MSIPTYNLGYPQNGSTLGQSKATIRNNLDGTFLTVSVNHYNQNSSYPGQHKFIQFPNSSMFAPPVPNLGTEIDLYNGGSTLGGANNLFLLPPGSTSLLQAIQLTRASNFPTSNSTSGFSWLPGGFLIQWGFNNVNPAGASTLIAFPTAFSSPSTVYSITIGNIINTNNSDPGANSVFVRSSATTNASFRVVNSSSSGELAAIYWMAIGT
jgi:hypothetical protein